MAECSGAEAAALQESVDLSGWIFPMECQIQEELKIITWLHLSKAAGWLFQHSRKWDPGGPTSAGRDTEERL